MFFVHYKGLKILLNYVYSQQAYAMGHNKLMFYHFFSINTYKTLLALIKHGAVLIKIICLVI